MREQKAVVSIPFKRESLSKAGSYKRRNHEKIKIKFQFPSNGKAYPKEQKKEALEWIRVRVSIPFKRESLSKAATFTLLQITTEFQFPSNGKAYPKGDGFDRSSNYFSFNSLQTGKPIQRGNDDGNDSGKEVSFNSLQTGKPIQSITFAVVAITDEVSIPFKRESLSKDKGVDWDALTDLRQFQFPSNGKAYPKLLTHLYNLYLIFSFNSLQTGKPIQSNFVQSQTELTELVSIPFKRESLSKESWNRRVWIHRRVSIPFKRESLSKESETPEETSPESESFNSLQTGKPIQSYLSTTVSKPFVVSIPFKRESLSKVTIVTHRKFLRHRFQFPSNGKAYPKRWTGVLANIKIIIVSIPFKRESLSKVLLAPGGQKVLRCVSIPFKRESLSKAPIFVNSTTYFISFNSLQTGKPIQRKSQVRECPKCRMSFNSLQTGKPIQRIPVRQTSPDTHFRFQFPSNGKAYPKNQWTNNQRRQQRNVSIPFKRESLSKGKAGSET